MDNTVSVLVNTTAAGAAAASFAPQQTFATGRGPVSAAMADVNGDGKPDIVVANEMDNTVSVLVNTTAAGAAAASFAPQQTFATGSEPFSVKVADLNGDGKPDIVVANMGNNTVSVLVNTTAAGAAAASFVNQQTFSTGNAPDGVSVMDLTGDGRPDIVAANQSDGTVSVLTNLDLAPQLVAPGTVTITNTAVEVTLVTTTTGALYRIDATGPHLVVNGFIANASATAEPSGEVTLLTTTTGDLYRIDGSGIRLVVSGIIASASIAYEPSGEVTLVTTRSGDLYRIDGSGIRLVVGGLVASASVVYEPSGEVTLVTTRSGDLYRIDATGPHLVVGGIIAGASVAYGPTGEVTLVTTRSGDLYRIDATGPHLVVGGIISYANVTYEP
jgi:hypothetical protein